MPATITDSGPAAARRPFLGAMDSNEAVGGGSESLGHGDGSNCNFDSPAIAWNPSTCQTSQCYHKLTGASRLTSVDISSNSGPCFIVESLDVPAVLPNGEGLARKAILALSKFGETVRTSRFKKYL